MPKKEYVFGRPTKFEDSFCDKAFRFLAEEKCRGVTALSAHLGVDEKTIYRWRKEYPEFKEAIEKGLSVSKALLMADAAKHLVSTRDTNYNTPLFSRLMQSIYRDSESSTVLIEGYAEAKTIEEKLELIERHAAEGFITTEQAERFSNLIMKRAQLVDMVQLKERLDSLEAQQ